MAEEMTALQKKWAEERAAQQEVEVKEEESLRPENMDQSVIDRIPKPTGWRIVVLPFCPPKKTKSFPISRLDSHWLHNQNAISGEPLTILPKN